MASTFEEAETQLKNVEASLKRVITQIENSCIDTSIKSAFVAEIEEILSEIHHLTPHNTVNFTAGVGGKVE